MWTEVSSSVLHFLHLLLLNPNIYNCLLKVLCPVSRPITAMDSVLLKDNNQALVARSGPEINSWACLRVLQGPRHNTRCWFSIQRFIFLLIFCLETPKKGSGPTNCWTEPSLASLLEISFPRTPVCPGTHYSLTTGTYIAIPLRYKLTYPMCTKLPGLLPNHHTTATMWASPSSWIPVICHLVFERYRVHTHVTPYMVHIHLWILAGTLPLRKTE
jgi:hypothetical protein